VLYQYSATGTRFFSEENRRGSGASTENLLKTTKKVATKQNKVQEVECYMDRERKRKGIQETKEIKKIRLLTQFALAMILSGGSISSWPSIRAGQS
jgi:hypothetical protein